MGWALLVEKDALSMLAAWHSDAESIRSRFGIPGNDVSTHVAHRRRVRFTKEPFSFVVIDSLHGRGSHTVESFIHFTSRFARGFDGARPFRILDQTGPPQRSAYAFEGASNPGSRQSAGFRRRAVTTVAILCR